MFFDSCFETLRHTSGRMIFVFDAIASLGPSKRLFDRINQNFRSFLIDFPSAAIVAFRARLTR